MWAASSSRPSLKFLPICRASYPRRFIFINTAVRSSDLLDQCFSTFVRPRPGKFFFYKTRVRLQQIYSKIHFQFFEVHT
jgi:hypothetical protein